MLRGNRNLRTAQAVTLAVAAIMMVAIVAVALSAHDASDDWGVVWSEPASMSLDSIDTDESGEGLDLVFHLADAKGLSTEWGGALSLVLTDENFQPVYERVVHVRARDFTTVNVDGTVDTFYVLHVPFEHMSHVTEDMVTSPSTQVSVLATFTYGQQTLRAERFWWHPPTYVKVETFYVVEDEGWILYDVFLFDEMWRPAKWAGDLRIIVHDSTGAEMYNDTEAISPADFNMFSWGDTGWAWYRGWVLFEDVHPSMDRIEEEGDNGSGRWMRVIAEFRYEGVHLVQDPEGYTAVKNTLTIPDGLLKENTPPSVRLTADRWGLTGREQSFDASGTRDDMGTEGLLYEWSWGDGTLTEVTDEPVMSHTFTRAGSFRVNLRVVDIEGAHSDVEVDVQVLQDPRVDPSDIGEGELVEKVLDFYPLERLWDLRR
jgi:hypothetical protein